MEREEEDYLNGGKRTEEEKAMEIKKWVGKLRQEAKEETANEQKNLGALYLHTPRGSTGGWRLGKTEELEGQAITMLS